MVSGVNGSQIVDAPLWSATSMTASGHAERA
jgi:hypothetical protein